VSLNLTEGQHAHFVGIGGIGMSALARLLRAKGYRVSGSDSSQGGQFEELRREGFDVKLGHDPAYLDDADLVIVTSAAGGDNPEVSAARQRRMSIMKRAEVLASVFNPSRGIAVAGTHGKTTTTALIGWMLTAAGRDPTVIVGGIASNLGSNLRIGDSDLVVVEADEYDASFLALHPEVAVITNVEADHLDFYGTLDAVHRAFIDFAKSVSRTLVVNADDGFLRDLPLQNATSVRTFGFDHGEVRATHVRAESLTSFTVREGGSVDSFRTPLSGKHYILNALAAVTVARELGLKSDEIARGLETFKGVKRRLEVRGERDGVLVMDTYAHHPTEIAADIVAIRERDGGELRVVFQPHTYSRTKHLLDDLAMALSKADHVYLLDVYAAREVNTYGIGSWDLVEKLLSLRSSATYCSSFEEAAARVKNDARPGDVVVTMGAGDVDQLVRLLLYNNQ
jgi:UDP-N-acetylmuramate--alanine ligase